MISSLSDVKVSLSRVRYRKLEENLGGTYDMWVDATTCYWRYDRGHQEQIVRD